MNVSPNRFSLAIRASQLALITLLLTACGHQHVTDYPPLPSDSTTAFCQNDSIGTAVALSDNEQIVLDEEDRRDERTIEVMLKRAALDIAEASSTAEACRETIVQGEALFHERLLDNQARLADRGGFDPSDDAAILAVQERITDLWRADQSARSTVLGFPRNESRDVQFWANRLASAHAIRTDLRSTAYLESLLDDYDWIDQDRFGDSISAHAWILVQHADHRVDLQAEVLARMQPYFENGGIRPANYAYLWDRVAVNSDQPQRYGTQPIWTCEAGQLSLAPIEDLERADVLRSELGMNTVAQQLEEMSRAVCGGS